MITPDEVRGSAATLNEAIRNARLADAGEGSRQSDLSAGSGARRAGVRGGPSLLRGRLIFTNSVAGRAGGRVRRAERRHQRRDRCAGEAGLSRPHAHRRRHRTGAHQRPDAARSRALERSADVEHRLSPVGAFAVDQLCGVAAGRVGRAVQPGQRARPDAWTVCWSRVANPLKFHDRSGVQVPNRTTSTCCQWVQSHAKRSVRATLPGAGKSSAKFITQQLLRSGEGGASQASRSRTAQLLRPEEKQTRLDQQPYMNRAACH